MSDSTPTPFTIEFEVRDPARFEQLRVAFCALKAAKDADSLDDEDPNWLTYFDDHAKRFFHWSDHLPGRIDGEPWGESRWYFWSMIHVIGCGDYELVHCKMIAEDRAEIAFNPGGYPFGGTGSLRVLFECFGFKPIKDWDDAPFPTWAEVEEAYRKLGK